MSPSVPGRLALVGSGEFLPVMNDVDAELLEGRPRRAVILSTAAAPEGPGSVARWHNLGRSHFEAMQVEPDPLPVADHGDADDAALAARVEGAGLVYLSGGNPGYLADSLRGSRVWEAIVAAWRAGAALAGCSAGAMAMTAYAPEVRKGRAVPGLALVPHLAVIPHFDRFAGSRPQMVGEWLSTLAPDVQLLGIDEDTALVWTGEAWVVRGVRAVWTIGRGGQRSEHRAGTTVDLAPPP